MTPERYRQIGEIYHAALEVEGEERAAFLERACANDIELRREVESLIASHEQAANFIATPALAVAAGLIVQRDSLVGQTVAHYRVLSLVGEGGMGEVYLAEDTRLGRRVALKLLSAAFTNDADRMRRFMQEARAASALNHPNILTVHEIGRVNGVDFIATEFIEGETLRPSMAKRRLRLSQALDIAAQVAGALAAAHAAGVVHRDIKPENIMVRPDGYVKVLDFGLAKLAGPGLETGNEASTVTRVETNPGVVMGTVQYMSPEQARGLPVDARTDVWSLGVVLYEMVASRPPFEGATRSDTIVSILEREPALLARLAPETPAELERIVTKALTKNAEERYQTVKDMAIDLRRLRRRQEVEAEIERSAAPEASSSDAAVIGRQTAVVQESMAVRTGQVETAAATSSIEYLVSEVKRHKRGAAVGGALVIVLAGLAYSVYRFNNKNQPPTKPAALFQTTRITRLTTDGKASEAAISPDGKYVVYVKDDGRQSLWVRQVATGSEVQIIPPSEIEYLGITFSPNGDYVYYVTREKSGESALYQMPAIGGASRKLLAGIMGPISFSPEGERFAFVRSGREESSLVIANADGTGQQGIASRKFPNNFWYMPAWSKDGKIIACAARNFDDGFHLEVVGVQVDDRKVQLIFRQRWYWIDHLMWLSDSSGLLMTGTDQAERTPQVWFLPYPHGEPRKITNDLNTYVGLSLTAASNILATVSSTDISNIWTAPSDNASLGTQLTSGVGRYDGAEGISWTPDGKIVFRSWAKGTNDVWVVERDGSNLKQVMENDPDASGLSVSPDGQYIVFSSRRGGDSDIWRTDIDGANAKQLTLGGDGSRFLPSISPDGKWVVYSFFSDLGPTIWKLPVDGGDSVRLSDKRARSQSISPDGKLIACGYFGDQRSSIGIRMAVIPIEGGPPAKIFDVRLSPFSKWRSFGSLDTIRWSPDGHSLTYIDTLEGVSNIWSQPLDGGKPLQLTNFKTGRIFNFAWSRDGKWLALARGSVTSDVVLISDLR